MILAAGLTPAWQQILTFDQFAVGEVNRANAAHWCASGKVLNTGIALHHLGAECKTLALIGGTAGRAIADEFSDVGIPVRWVESNTPTRVCTTILDSCDQQTTELVEVSGRSAASELAEFTDAFAEESAAADVVVLSGSLPVGTPPSFYRELLERTKEKPRPTTAILDARSDELLQALPMKPYLVKPNREELAKTLDRHLGLDENLVAAMHEINDRGAEWVVVTQGKHNVWATSGGSVYQLRPPTVTAVNPIGCGDCLAAGIALATSEGRAPLDAIRFGMAAAAENLAQLLPARIDRSRVEDLAAGIELVNP